jgi:hypothetical protein
MHHPAINGLGFWSTFFGKLKSPRLLSYLDFALGFFLVLANMILSLPITFHVSSSKSWC